MAEKSELAAALKDVLEKRGILPEVKARLRSEVYNALDDQTTTKPKLCRENFLLNELIREYCEFNQYNYTRSVLLMETGQPKESLDRQFLASELNMPDRDSSVKCRESVGLVFTLVQAQVPLLYQMMDSFMKTSPDMANCTATSGHRPHSQVVSTSNALSQEKGTVLNIEKPTYINTT